MKTSTIIFGVTIGISALVGLYFLPLLIAHLDRQRRVYLVIQQICITLYMILEGAPFLFFSEVTLGSLIHLNSYIKSSNYHRKDVIDYHIYTLLPEILRLFGDFFYSIYYLFSILHTYDVMMMVCQPLNYADFSKWKNITRRILMGSFCCLLLAFDNFVIILTRIWYSYFKANHTPEYFFWQNDILMGSHIFRFVKILVIKLGYAWTNTTLFFSVRKCLNESAQLSKSYRAKSQKNLLYFIRIPFLINIIFLGHDVPGKVDAILHHYYAGTEHRCSTNFLRKDIMFGLSTVALTMGSFTYYVGYVLFFPKIRKAFLLPCKRDAVAE